MKIIMSLQRLPNGVNNPPLTVNINEYLNSSAYPVADRWNAFKLKVITASNNITAIADLIFDVISITSDDITFTSSDIATLKTPDIFQITNTSGVYVANIVYAITYEQLASFILTSFPTSIDGNGILTISIPSPTVIWTWIKANLAA